MRRPTENFLCSFKCPFCGDRVEVTTEIKPDKWVEVRGSCDGQTEKICWIGFDFGVFGPGFNQQEMKSAVMEIVGTRFIN